MMCTVTKNHMYVLLLYLARVIYVGDDVMVCAISVCESVETYKIIPHLLRWLNFLRDAHKRLIHLRASCCCFYVRMYLRIVH